MSSKCLFSCVLSLQICSLKAIISDTGQQLSSIQVEDLMGMIKNAEKSKKFQVPNIFASIGVGFQGNGCAHVCHLLARYSTPQPS